MKNSAFKPIISICTYEVPKNQRAELRSVKNYKMRFKVLVKLETSIGASSLDKFSIWVNNKVLGSRNNERFFRLLSVMCAANVIAKSIISGT